MTIHDLYRLKNIRSTAAVVQNQIDALNRYGEENEEVRKILVDALGELLKLKETEEGRLNRFIESVEDQELKEILWLRFEKGLPWVEVAAEVSPLDKDSARTAPLMRVRRYLKKRK